MEKTILTLSEAKTKVKEFTQESSYTHFSVFVRSGSTFLAYGVGKNTIVDMDIIEERERQSCKELRIPYPSNDVIEPKITISSMITSFNNYLKTLEYSKIEIGTDRGSFCLIASPPRQDLDEILAGIRIESAEKMEKLEAERLDYEEERLAQNNLRHTIELEDEEDDDDTPEADRPLNLKKTHNKQRVGRDEFRGRMDSLDWDDIVHKVENNLTSLSDLATEHGVSYAGMRYRLKKLGIL